MSYTHNHSQSPRTGLMWFRHDLRVADNPALTWLNRQVDQMVCVFVVDPRWFRAGHYQSAHLGEHRKAFLRQTLEALNTRLQEYGQRLVILDGVPVDAIEQLIARLQISHVAANDHPGVYERQQWARLQKSTPHAQFHGPTGHTLFEPDDLPFPLQALPDTFTPFRKKVEPLEVGDVLSAPEYLAPPPPEVESLSKASLLELLGDTSPDLAEFSGGEGAAMAQLNQYLFATDRVKTYKQTRNGLDGWEYSSKLSAWLANGSLSARQVYHQLKGYEAQRVSNESTYWLYFELLWREFFQWYLYRHRSELFRFSGVRGKRPLTTFLPMRFKSWCAGTTAYPIVNACMRQLNATGYMSNRGRQLVASCLVHELGVDWRFGAAYFEQQLIDFDVAANWGNWQYLAGVGADPRGHRRFDLEKQTRQYDPDGEFVNRWQGQQSPVDLEVVDAADWPKA